MNGFTKEEAESVYQAAASLPGVEVRIDWLRFGKFSLSKHYSRRYEKVIFNIESESIDESFGSLESAIRRVVELEKVQ